jgi:hypothetical protein
MNTVKQLLSTFSLLLLAIISQAQMSNIVIFTQANEPFTVILNGIQQCPDPVTNVKITGLNAPSYKLKVIFQNLEIPEIDKTVYLQPEVEVSYEILKNSKAIWVIRMLNSTPVDEIVEQQVPRNIFVYTTIPRISTTVVTQSTTVSTGGLTGGASITTTTTHTTSGGGEVHVAGNQDIYDDNHHERPDYDGPRGCPRPMGAHSFDQALESISSKSFESSKLTIAKQIAGSNCLLCKQVKEIMTLFTFESNRLEFAKYAYKYTWDINNYFLLNDAFEFESSIDELNRYINKK